MSKVVIDYIILDKLIQVKRDSKHSIVKRLDLAKEHLLNIEPISSQIEAIKMQRKRLREGFYTEICVKEPLVEALLVANAKHHLQLSKSLIVDKMKLKRGLLATIELLEEELVEVLELDKLIEIKGL